MIWLFTRPVVWPLKVGAASAATGFRAGRLVGYRRLSVLLVGVLIGLLVAPFPGKDLRARLRARLAPDEMPSPLQSVPTGRPLVLVDGPADLTQAP